ncbi:probable E3 ubiquitin-protein ligase EDA40 [Cannabis sativa]|uniref:probable E3 ubiquitin-protein ligase EDA40 n=1 Tax=Cannabis sativa TaxID=3483 RepID=UPI0029CA6B63|nr:probable E3 ubiquitin-protein ligase EDA40 [Cannabis sativa]
MSYNDDEQIVSIQDVPEKNSTQFPEGKTKLSIINKSEAPLEENKLKVMLELTGSGLGNDRSGVDLVTVLDVSGSMGGEKLAKMKMAMQFVIKKLSSIDRLSVVTFNGNSMRLCPLRQITENAQSEIENLVTALIAEGATNISAGLETGLKVVNDRTLSKGRVVGIMLMSDGQQNGPRDATKVEIGNVPVYTFGFGADHDPTVLKIVADNSAGGTFSAVQNEDNLSIAFSQCLAGLLTVVVQDLKLTLTEVETESSIENVSAGNYPQSKDIDAGSVTISFGDLYDKEIRKVLVHLLLPSIPKPRGADVLTIDYNYSTGGKLFRVTPQRVNIRRKETLVEETEKEDVMMEDNRLFVAKTMKEARSMANDKRLEEARDKIVDAQNMLEDGVAFVDESSPNYSMVEMLRFELQQLSRLMKSEDIYEKQGRPFLLSSETSHDRQRFASRGDVDRMRLFATPRMNSYLEQAKAFDEDPTKPLPNADDDLKEELEADPLGPIVGALSYYIQSAIQSLQAIDNIIKNGR